MRFAATMADFERAFDALRAALASHEVDPAARFRVELVFEEVAANVMRHGVGQGSAVPEVDFTVELAAGAIVLTFLDNGPLFNPVAHPDPARPASLDDAPVGGRGLMLVRKTATDMHYECTADRRNRLTVRLPPTPGQSAA